MKTRITSIGIIALYAIIGFALIACSSGPSQEEYRAMQERLNQLERQQQQQQRQQSTPQTATAQQAQQYNPESHFQTEAISGGLRITNYTGPNGAVHIPPTIGGLPVTEIGKNAFQRYDSQRHDRYFIILTSVTIPSSVTTIGTCAFYGQELTSVIIPSSVTTIGTQAFQYNNTLNNVTIGSNVTLSGARMELSGGSSISFGVFDRNLDQYYYSQGRRAGTYVFSNGAWQRQ
jgi:hypothetical protein